METEDGRLKVLDQWGEKGDGKHGVDERFDRYMLMSAKYRWK